MFHLLDSTISIAQHHRLDIMYLAPNQELNETEMIPGTDFVASSGARLITDQMTGSGVFCASLIQPYRIEADSPTIIIRTYGTRALDKIAFPNWQEPGALSYIDGCSNTNVVSPVRNGDPCLNYLFFPPGTKQSLHTHPSVRIGVILDGEGVAVLPQSDGTTLRVPLVPGSAFLLDRHTLHAFNTTGSHMSLFAFHPDSEAGPTDEGNPMKVRTYLR